MKKTTAYARKHRRTGAQFNGAEWLNSIQRCQPYTTEIPPGGWVEGTQSAADSSICKVRTAFDSLKSGRTLPANEKDFDRLVHALSVSCLRAGQIAGDQPADNEMLPPLIAGNLALKRVLTRRQRFGKWELLTVDVTALDWAIEIYETILQASSPPQMVIAADLHAAWLKGQALETIDLFTTK